MLVFDGQIIPHVSGRAITVPNYDIDEGIVESMFWPCFVWLMIMDEIMQNLIEKKNLSISKTCQRGFP